MIKLALVFVLACLWGCGPTVEPSAPEGGSGSTSSSSTSSASCVEYCGDVPIADFTCEGHVYQCDAATAPASCVPLPTTHALTCPDGSSSLPFCCP